MPYHYSITYLVYAQGENIIPLSLEALIHLELSVAAIRRGENDETQGANNSFYLVKPSMKISQ
jgi:hypothetical protein